MGRKRHTPEQIITALREAEVGLARGKSVKLISRELGITWPLGPEPRLNGSEIISRASDGIAARGRSRPTI